MHDLVIRGGTIVDGNTSGADVTATGLALHVRRVLPAAVAPAPAHERRTVGWTLGAIVVLGGGLTLVPRHLLLFPAMVILATWVAVALGCLVVASWSAVDDRLRGPLPSAPPADIS